MIGPEWLRLVAEIGSDAFAFASAAAVIVPVYKTLKLRKRLAELSLRIRELGASHQEQLHAILREQALRLGEFDPLEERLIIIGIWCLAIAVVLRIGFHLMTKLDSAGVSTALGLSSFVTC